MIIPHIKLETSLWEQGYRHVAGVDEAGRGPLAGPVTAGAVIIHKKDQIVSSVRDSKLMSALQRNHAFDHICQTASAYGIGIATNEEIDTMGIAVAVKLAMIRALEATQQKLGEQISYVIVDGSKTQILEGYHTQRILRGGLYHYSIAAGSILAKVTRDRLMDDYTNTYPQYGFSHHKGYGTKDHMNALETYGPCPIHRKSFAPVKRFTT